MEKRYPRTILATACIPWTESLVFDEAVFREEIRGLIRRGVRNIYLFGTAGEGYAVTDEQFETIVRAFAEEMEGPDLYPMVGLISLSLGVMGQRLKTAYALGIRDFQVSLPSWGALTDEELFSFFHRICDPYPDCRFFHYNLMRSKRVLGIREYEKLAGEIPNLAGVKYSTTDMAVILEIAKSDCPIRFYLTDIGFAYGSLVGEFGFLISIASTNFVKAWEYYKAGAGRDVEKLLAMQRELSCLGQALMRITGKPMIDGAYDKMFCKAMDSRFPLRLLPPYEFTSDASFDEYIGFIRKEFPQWIES